MRPQINGPDLAAGLLLVAIGAFFFWAGNRLALGSVRMMGPGFFPRALAILIIGLGSAIALRASFTGPIPLPRPSPWPILWVLLSLSAFAVLLQPFGLPAAVIAAVLVARVPSLEGRPLEVLVQAVALAALSSVVFVTLLGLPLKISPV